MFQSEYIRVCTGNHRFRDSFSTTEEEGVRDFKSVIRLILSAQEFCAAVHNLPGYGVHLNILKFMFVEFFHERFRWNFWYDGISIAFAIAPAIGIMSPSWFFFKEESGVIGERGGH